MMRSTPNPLDPPSEVVLEPLRTLSALADVVLTFPRRIPIHLRLREQFRRLHAVSAPHPGQQGSRDGAARTPLETSPLRVTLIGRGHSGTRAFVESLLRSGVYMHYDRPKTYDYVGDCAIYEAARIFGSYVDRVGEHEWDFRRAIEAPIPPRFVELVERHLRPIDGADGAAGYKLPETTLIFPWLVRLRPDLHYVHWVRDPRDGVLHQHLTDGLAKFGVPMADSDLSWIFSEPERLKRRAISWKYQHDLVAQTPKPPKWKVVRFEDFILDHERVNADLGQFLGLALTNIETRPDAVGRWKGRAMPGLELLRPLMEHYGYE